MLLSGENLDELVRRRRRLAIISYGLARGRRGRSNSGGGGASAEAPDVISPVLSSPTAVETSPTTADLSVTTDEAGGVLRYAILPTASAAPSAAAFAAGTTGGITGLDNSPTVGVNTFEATGLTHSTAYKAHFCQHDSSNNPSNVVTSAEFTTDVAPDVTAPVLSSPLGTQTGSSTADLGVTSDEANGTLYVSVLPTASAAPSAAAFIAGTTGGVYTSTDTTPSVGANTFSATGLAASTAYKAHYFQEDAAGNDSNIVSSAEFTTSSLPAADAPVLTQTSADGANPLTFTITFGDFIIDTDVFEFRHRVNAGAWVDETSQPVTSAWYDDHIIDGDPISKPNYEGATFSSGEDVGVQAGITRGAAATVWSTELTDEMAVTDVTFSYGDKATSAASSTSVSFLTKAFAGGGRALIVLTCYSNAGGSVDSVPTALTITPSAGGAGINCTKLGSGGRAASRAFAIYLSDSDVSATNYDITGTRPNAARSNTVMWGTLIGANATPTSGPTFTSGSGSNPHVSTSLTVVANGLAIGGYMLENNATVAANAGTTVIDQNFFNSECGLALCTRTTTGTLSVNATPDVPYNWGKGIAAFGP